MKKIFDNAKLYSKFLLNCHKEAIYINNFIYDKEHLISDDGLIHELLLIDIIDELHINYVKLYCYGDGTCFKINQLENFETIYNNCDFNVVSQVNNID